MKVHNYYVPHSRAYKAQEAEETVITAIRSGINFIDTGPHYGLGKAETFLGKVRFFTFHLRLVIHPLF